MRNRILPTSVVAALILACLAGCTPTVPVAIPTPFVVDTPVPTATPSPTVTPVPTITPVAPTKPTLAELVVSPDGIAPLVIGETVKVVPPALALVKFNANHCGNPGEVGNAGWDTSYPGRTFTIETKPATATGVIQTILVSSSHLGTATGMRIGSTVAQLKAAYGQFDRIISRPAVDLYIIRGTHGQLVFEVARQATFGTDKTPYWPKDEVGRVQFLSIWQLSATPVGFSGTDGGPGSCA